MLKLGHIIYSNCLPPHAGIIDKKVEFPYNLVEGIPTDLNRMLHEGTVDVSPSSSIEYAVNPGRYLLFPDLSITSRRRVGSILLESKTPISGLDRKVVAMTAASATSVVLLRILLELQHGLKPRYITYEQGVEDPSGASDAMLTIGDLAIVKPATPGFGFRYDLGELWYGFTGLPFVFALWQVNYRKDIEQDLKRLYAILKLSKEYGLSHLEQLSKDLSPRYRIAPQTLHAYWKSFSYDFGDAEQQGLLAYYRYAAELGVIEPVSELQFWQQE